MINEYLKFVLNHRVGRRQLQIANIQIGDQNNKGNMEQGDTKVTAEEVSGLQTCTEVATKEISEQQTCTEVATEEVSGQQICTEVDTEEVSGQQTCTEVATEVVSGQETCSETCKLADSDRCGDIMKMPGKDGNNIASYSSEGCGNNTMSTSNEGYGNNIVTTSNEGCGNDIVSTSNEERRVAGEGDPPSDFFDDFFREEFLEGLDIVDSWIDEGNDDGNENKTEKSNKETRSRSDRNSDERKDRGRDDRRIRSWTDTRRRTYDRRDRVTDDRKDRTEGDSRNSRRGSQTDRSVPEVSSLDKKDDGRSRRGRSSDRRDASRNQRARSPRRERSLENSDPKRTRGERVQEKREDNRVHREGSLERKDDNHVRKERSNEKRDDNRVHREKSLEKRDESRRERLLNSRRYARYRKTPEKRDNRVHRERSQEKEDDSRRNTRVLHREKSLERKPIKGRSYDRGNKDKSSEKVSGSVREGEEERRKESDRGERIDQAKKLEDRQGEHGNRKDDSVGGSKDKPVESNSVQQVTAEKLKMEVSVVSYPHPNLYKKLREENKSEENIDHEGNFFKQLPPIAPNEPVPPGTEDEYIVPETTPKDKSDVTTENDKIISGDTKQEKTEAVESKVSSSDHTKEGKAKNIDKRSVSPKRKKRSRSTSTERARKLREEKQLKINRYFNMRFRQQRAIREQNQTQERTSEINEKSRRSRDRTSRFSGPTTRERSRERLGKNERSVDRRLPERQKDRFGNREKPFEGDLKLHSTSAEEQKSTPRPLSPAIYERFSSPSLSLELSPVSSARERSLSRSPSRERYKRARRHRSRRHSLSPISLSDSSLSLTSESEYERKKRNYNRSRQQRKPPFLKELAELLAADSAKRSSYPTPPPGYVDGPQNTPHLEMVPPDVVYQPAPVDHLMPGYPQPMFQPGGIVPAEEYPPEEYPPEAYPQHLPPNVMQPYMPHMPPQHEGPPPTDFVFSLPHPHPGVPHDVPMSGPLPAGDPNMFQFQGGHIPPEMNHPNIHPAHPYPPEAYHGGDPFSVPQNSHIFVENPQAPSFAPPPPMISDGMPKKMSLSSVLEASVKVSKQQIGSERDAVIQRCEKAIQILKADEHLVNGGCFTFVPVASQNIGLDNQASGPHAYLSPLLSGKNLTFSFTKPPEPKKQPATVKKTVLNAVRSLLAERSLPVPEPPKPCERCLEYNKKTFVDSSVQTNEVVLCSVATQSDYQSSSENDFHRLDMQNRVQSDMFHAANRSRVGSEFENQQFSRMMREDLPLDIKHGRPSDFSQSMNFPSNLPFRDFARNDVLPESRSVNMSPPRRESMPFDPRSSDFLNAPNLNRPAHSSSGPFSGLPLKGILKSSRQSASDMFAARPEQDIPAHKSKDVWSRLGPLSSSGHPYGGDPEPLALSGGPDNPDLHNRFSSIPSGMTREEYQRYFMGLSNQQRIDKFGPFFNSSGPYSQTR
ncbi:calponin homology domain-containing protein DDB_G0272472 isoform X2 [Anabrus simplex]|uniref:calponin homology domain-containing protein DDB_G0272472 isoform X2 n=1 Tax=Anabrus simplex TaxID=316456 RepID=UPI0035A2D599